MGDGTPPMQLNYSAGYTTLSAFLPIVCLFIAFGLLEIQQPDQPLFLPFLVVAGFIVGLSICGMYYVGNCGISNYSLYNPIGFILGAAIIAIIASILALAIFFYFREKWINNLAVRLSCATVLAAAVSGMHWLATAGTTYVLKVEDGGRTGDRDIILIVGLASVRYSPALEPSTNGAVCRCMRRVPGNCHSHPAPENGIGG
jgi:NO-binding membrane sensor protein with MHYT domain